MPPSAHTHTHTHTHTRFVSCPLILFRSRNTITKKKASGEGREKSSDICTSVLPYVLRSRVKSISYFIPTPPPHKTKNTRNTELLRRRRRRKKKEKSSSKYGVIFHQPYTEFFVTCYKLFRFPHFYSSLFLKAIPKKKRKKKFFCEGGG